MPARQDIESILIIGAGPIIIGQACEFDYSGVQACRVLTAEGYRVILANSNPATIMTDPDFADATYLEPLTVGMLERIISREKPDALLPTLGGQTALNLTMGLDERGALKDIQLLGASKEAIITAENRASFKTAMADIGISLPNSLTADSYKQAENVLEQLGLPVIVRPAYILGGAGAGLVESEAEFEEITKRGLSASPIGQILIEESLKGWKEFELEVMRDAKDNCVVVCSIENLDPMGVHTGDSITVAPAQTLSNSEYQAMRDDAFACIRKVGVETGGSNIQFAVNPEDGRRVIIEMNPRVSRSSALASKATGFPIAKIAAKLAVGYSLDEIPNDITKATPACFEPSIDYVVTKIPRFAFEKFPGTSEILGASMQSVGEAMAIGRTFPESLQKGIRSLELGRYGLNSDAAEEEIPSVESSKADSQNIYESWRAELLKSCATPTPDRIFKLETAIRAGHSPEELNRLTGIDKWFLDQIAGISAERQRLEGLNPADLAPQDLKRAKQMGFSDVQLARLWQLSEDDVKSLRLKAGVKPVYKTVDTCAGEFSASTPYHYSTYEDSTELAGTSREKIMILGSGPNRIGQGIEFDYCCVHASFALKESGYETIMVNCNPETVSTDYDTSDRLFFEPLTKEDVLNIIESENEAARQSNNPGVTKVIVSLGGQTPLKLAESLPAELIAGTPGDSIDLAEDRQRWSDLCARLKIPIPIGGIADSRDSALRVAADIGYPLLIRPSYVLGGRAMVIAYNDEELLSAMQELSEKGNLGKEGGLAAKKPVLLDSFLEDAIEVDVDALRDVSGEVLVGGIMEHVEEAGVHSGDSACILPPSNLSKEVIQLVKEYTVRIADSLGVVGLINIQFAVTEGDQVFVLEANPRASRTVPFVSKATGIPLAKIGTRLMMGQKLQSLRNNGLLEAPSQGGHISVKEAVLPFGRFHGADVLLGPEMRSTGEVMSIDTTPGLAFGKSQVAAGADLRAKGAVFISLADRHKRGGMELARRIQALGFELVATKGTAAALEKAQVKVSNIVPRIKEAPDDARPLDAVELIAAGKIAFVVNTPQGQGARSDGARIRRAATQENILLFTTLSATEAAIGALEELKNSDFEVRSLQEYHGKR